MLGDKVIYLSTYIKDLKRALDDADWEGHVLKAKHLQKQLDEALELDARGDKYYPLF